MTRRLSIYCPGAYTYRNKGDAALVSVLLAELRRAIPNAQISVSSDTPQLDQAHYPVRVLPPIHGYLLESEPRAGLGRESTNGEMHVPVISRRIRATLNRLSQRLEHKIVARWGHFTPQCIRLLWFLFRAQCAILRGPKALGSVVPPCRRDALAALRAADLVVFVPGGYFLAPHERHVHWYRHLAALLLAKWLRKPIVLAPMTIGPIYGALNRYLARLGFRGATQIWLREASSYDALVKLKVLGPKIRVTTDIAFLLAPHRTARVQDITTNILAKYPSPRIGVSVRHYDFPGHPSPSTQLDLFKLSVAHLVRHVVDRYDGSVFFVPQVTGETIDDLQVSDEVASRAGCGDRTMVLRVDLSPSELAALYGTFHAFVGVRMHANIFALGSSVPTLAIAYEPKTRGIMRSLGLEQFVLDIRSLQPAALLSKFDELIAHHEETRTLLRLRLDSVRAEAGAFATEISRVAADLQKP